MKNNSEKGSFTIETCLALPIFMFGFLAIVSLAKIARLESMTQYAIDQVAKEVSQYYYIAEKIGIANTDSSGVNQIDEAVGAIMDFNDKTSSTVKTYTSTTSNNISDELAKYQNISNDVTEISNAAQAVYTSVTAAGENWEENAKAFITLMVKQVGNEVMTRLIAQPLCKALVPKYITSDGNADETLKNLGVKDGLDGLNFGMSNFLSDQRSINVVVIYEVELEGFGIFDQTIVIKQTASTAAWVTGASLADVSSSESAWEKGDLERGKSYVSQIKQENSSQAVKAGIGVDLYDQSSNTFTSVKSMNVFSQSYSSYQKTGDSGGDADDYTLKKDKIKSTIKSYAKTLDSDMEQIGNMITMEDGSKCMTAAESTKHRNGVLTVVVPKEASSSSEHLKILNEVSSEIEKETGIKVQFTYRDEALGG